ncbi:MAG: hypothetical protein M1812_003416 [Candelaria pacifica]|nr:MAG: hypothetical protein M1812_003416 [Candelaria pacifica]
MLSASSADNGSAIQSQQFRPSNPLLQPSGADLGQKEANPLAATSNAMPKPAKRQRACEACRRMKVQCKWNSTEASACQRCTKAQRRCILTQRRPNRQRPNADIADLERKLEALTASLNTMRGNGKAQADIGEEEDRDDDHESFEGRHGSSFPTAQGHVAPAAGPTGFKSAAYDDNSLPMTSNSSYRVPRGHSVSSSHYHDSATSSHPSPESVAIPSSLAKPGVPAVNGLENYVDLVDQQILTLEEATYAFDHFVRNIAPTFPIIAFAEGTTAQQVRKRRPALFAAIMTASAGIWPVPQTKSALRDNMMRLFSDWVIMLGEKSMDLIQGLQVASLWYTPPADIRKMNYYQLIHIAGVMAIDVGINRRPPPRAKSKPSERQGSDAERPSLWFPGLDSIEGRRTWLSCWFLGAHTAQNHKRLNILTWSPYADECVEILETSPDAMQSDKILCRWIRLQHIIEDIGMHFSIDDPYRNPERSDNKIQYAIKGFEARLKLVATSSPAPSDSPVLKLGEEITNLFIHEVAMHVGQSDDRLKPPYTEEMLNSLRPVPNQALTATQIAYISTCLASIHTIFDLYLSIPLETITVLPSMHFVRLVYTVVVLIKIYLNVTMALDGDINKMLCEDDFNFEDQLHALVALCRATSSSDPCHIAPKFGFILNTLFRWFKKQRHGKYHSASNPNLQSSTYNASIAVGQNTEPSIAQSSLSNASYMPLQALSNAATGGTIPPDYASSDPSNDAFFADQPMFDYSAGDISLEQMGFNLDGENLSSYFVGNDPLASILIGVQPNIFGGGGGGNSDGAGAYGQRRRDFV